MAEPWTMLALTPLDAALLTTLFADLPVELVVPAERTRDAVMAEAGNAEIVLGGWTNDLPITAELVAAAPRLAFVQQPSVGVDTVDVAACTAAGVPVANAGDANAVSVAEWCVGSAFAVLRSLAHGDREVRAGRWPQLELAQRGGGELAGRRVGIVGMGRIARECAQRFVALGCDVAHSSRTRRDAADAGGAPWLAFEDLLRRSDVLVVLVALAPETRGLLGAEQLALLPPGAFVINAARGGIVDEAALHDALVSGRLAGAGLDVFEQEPPPAGHKLFALPNVIMAPHVAGVTREAVDRMSEQTARNILSVLDGEPLRQNVINQDVL
jgi:phosphoglycerate dehydrogenase-like enzyme